MGDEEEIVNETCGFIFLGTPHQGSIVSILGTVAAYITGFLGSNNVLLLSLFRHRPELSDLNERFIKSMKKKEDKGQRAQILSFIETKPTYVFKWFSIGLVSKRALFYKILLRFI